LKNSYAIGPHPTATLHPPDIIYVQNAPRPSPLFCFHMLLLMQTKNWDQGCSSGTLSKKGHIITQ